MTFDILKISSSDITTDVIWFCIGLMFFSILYRIIKPVRVSDMEIDEVFLSMFKFIGYGFLAGYIYLIVYKNGFGEIDVLTLFTFLLACFEATHNFMSSLGMWIAGLIRIIYDELFKYPRNY